MATRVLVAQKRKCHTGDILTALMGDFVIVLSGLYPDRGNVEEGSASQSKCRASEGKTGL